MNTITIRPFAAFKFLTLTALALVLLLLSGCRWTGVKGNGDIVTDTRTISAFTSVAADGAMEIKWTTGAPSLTITTDSNLLEHLHTRVSNGELHIEWAKPLRSKRGIKIKIASPSLERVQLNGAVRFAASRLSGRELYLEANGATKVTFEGNVNALSAEMNGASRLDAESLITRAMELSISGAGRAEVHVTEVLRVDIAGAGKVVYSGEPKTVTREISGAGSVRKRG
jgi:hypothetical protein